ncbi:uncharacterized protein ACA1_116840 [Acanthamoeba castellanii str. Neff]|uniref:Uncharacterized protein n=1 Tax=Acanthamoeba castellanii (strain ATCC 30010 / Neff) TaxID=1257118 RepID=L8H6X3_ACACF|nr:uncharacterized protein ACA1_116840 [Acanthamoeba castellanii str. Neff]ELR20211.1 hypothetical protein ACA1_116840 [Acanthamoeba castellanii str. Neff]
MGFHGEVMFLLLGVKPAVLCTFPAAACGPEAPTPSQLAVHYATQVMLPALRSGGGSASTNTSSDERTTWEVSVAGKRLLVGVVDANASSAYCDEVGGSLIVYILLDYPTHLKEGEELEDQQRRQPVIVEVGYWVVTSSAEGPELLTSYGAEEAERSVSSSSSESHEFQTECFIVLDDMDNNDRPPILTETINQ